MLRAKDKESLFMVSAEHRAPPTKIAKSKNIKATALNYKKKKKKEGERERRRSHCVSVN